MDYGDSGEINFEEYVFSMWDFLTNDLHHFVFQVFGKKSSTCLWLMDSGGSSCGLIEKKLAVTTKASTSVPNALLCRQPPSYVWADKDDSQFLTHQEMEQIMLCSYGVQFDGGFIFSCSYKLHYTALHFLILLIFSSENHNAKADQATHKLLKKTAINAVNIADRNNDKKITFEEYEFFVSQYTTMYM